MTRIEKYFIGQWVGRFVEDQGEIVDGVRLLIFEECGIVRFPQIHKVRGTFHVSNLCGVWRANGNDLQITWLDDEDGDGDEQITEVRRETDWFSWEAYISTYRYHRISPRPAFYALPLVSHTDDTGPVPQDLIERGSPA